MPQLEGTPLFAGVVTLTSLGFLMIGYDVGLMGGLVQAPAFIKTFDSPSAAVVGTIVAIFEVGSFLGSVATSIFGERIGRKKSILIGVCIMALGALLQATSYVRGQMIFARIVAGVGMGFVNSTVPVYQAEFSPKATRGLYVCMQLSTLNFGTFLVYWIDFGFSSTESSYAWRVPCILQCVFLLPMLILLAVLPETPRWLASHGRSSEVLPLLRRLYSNRLEDSEIRALYADITQTVALEASLGTGSWSDLIKSDAIESRRRFLIACAIQSFQQLGGINAIIYYAATIFQKSVGFSQHFAALMSGFLQTWFFIASFIPWFLLDRVGRRPLLLSMISLMAIVFAIQAALIYQVQFSTASAHSAGIAAAAMLFIYEGAFTIGFQATVWVYPSEILPLRLRQRGSSVSTACNWIFNFLVVEITPVAIANIGYKTYIIFALLNACWVPIIYVFFPETKGLQLEAVDRLFAKNSFDIPAAPQDESGSEKQTLEHMERGDDHA